MGAFFYGVGLQWRLDLRNKGILLVYYIVPLVFFAFMGGIFTSINPIAYQTLIPSMTIFGVTMGACIGVPSPLTEFYGSEMKKAYLVGKIPLYTAALNNFISGFIHMMIVSVLILLIAPPAFGAAPPEHFSTYFPVLVLFIATSLCMGTALGVLVKSSSRLTMISQIIFLPSIMLSGIMFPAEMLPEALQAVGKVFPATWGFQAMCGDAPEAQTILPMLAILLVTVAISVMGIKKRQQDK